MKNSVNTIDLFNEIFDSLEQYNTKIVSEHIKKLQELDLFFLPSQSFFILTNTVTNSYDFISENFKRTTGLKITDMMDQGVPFWFSRHHPKDLETWLVMMNELMNFTMNEVKFEDRKKLSYTWNLRIKGASGNYLNLYKHQTPITFDSNGKPNIGVSHNTIIGENIELPLIASIKILNSNNEYETLFYKNYSQQLLTEGLSNREKDILRLLTQGLTSKEIGHKLSISSHTVDGHRRKILKKTKLKSTGEIIQYCKIHQLF